MSAKSKTNRFLIPMVLLGLIAMSGCLSDIRIKPKDPELIKLGKFAEKVTKHLLDMNPHTYRDNQAALIDDLAPNALAQLIANNQCAKSLEDADQTAKAAESNGQRCIIQIESTSFPGQATSQGLVPIEVRGNCVKSKNYLSKAAKFDVLYYIGTSGKPITMFEFKSAKFIYFMLCLSLLFLGQPSQAAGTGESTGSTGSITITRHANEAAKAFAARDYAKAKDEYRKAIGLSPENLEFYYGLYDVCVHSGEWDQVVYALKRIFEIDPTKKQPLLAQYGEALFHLGQYDEAIPVLKQALKEADLPAPKISLVVPAPLPDPVSDKSATDTKPPPVPVAAPVVPPPRPVMSSKEVSQFGLSYLNAVHSECILIAEYVGYDKDKNADVHFTHPPIANYRITKILKGPPLNKDLPVRYEFTDRINDTQAPADWTFGPDKMPKKGSEWIIFLKIALPRDGAFDTYQGSYGRQPSNEENLNKLYSLLENSANR